MDLREYWADNPPLHVMVKAFLGGKEQKPEPTLSAADFIAQVRERRT